MAFFWVNLGRSLKEVEKHNFLWAPKYSFNKKGTKIENSGWKYVADVKKGDVIFCNENGEIVFVAVAKADAYSAPRPEGREYDQRKKEGNQIDVFLEKLDVPLDTDEFKDEFMSLYNDKCSSLVFTSAGNAAQQYLASIPDGAGALILNALGEASLPVQEKMAETTGTKRKITATERIAIVKARVGQGQFREDVLEVWKATCPITGINRRELLIASHIVSWQLSNDDEKLDKYNGLPLSPNLDKLFDKGFISFTDDGRILVNKSITADILLKLGIDRQAKMSGLHQKHVSYLKRHRSLHGY